MGSLILVGRSEDDVEGYSVDGVGNHVSFVAEEQFFSVLAVIRRISP